MAKEWRDGRRERENPRQRQQGPSGALGASGPAGHGLDLQSKPWNEQSWTEENTRSELKFDKKVIEQWFESELKRQYAGSVHIVGDDGRTRQEVPLCMTGIDRVQGFGDHGKPSIRLSFDNGGMSAPQMTWLSVEEGLKNRSVTANTGAPELMAHHRHQVEQQSLNMQRSQSVDVRLPPQNDPGQSGQNLPHQNRGGPSWNL